MKNLVFLLAIFLFACSSSNKLTKVPKDKFLETDSTIFKNEISKFHLSNADTLIDIGSGYGYNDEVVFKFYPGIFFILEDIHAKYLRQNTYFIIENGTKKYFKDSYKKIIGTTDTIPVASGKYKNVLCRITLHEFTNQAKMLKEFKRILASDGQLIIVERIPKFEGEIEKACKKKLLSKSEILTLFETAGFNLISSDSTKYTEDQFNGNANILRFSR